jgi:PIN domain-containing protein
VRVLFDLNVLIDVACRWQSFPDSLTLYQHMTASPTDQGAFAGCGYTTLYYIMNQIISEERTRAVLVHFCTQLTMIPFTLDVATTAQRLQMADLEDACIAASAFAGGCDVIASRNVGDFTASPIAAKTPTALLALLKPKG